MQDQRPDLEEFDREGNVVGLANTALVTATFPDGKGMTEGVPGVR